MTKLIIDLGGGNVKIGKMGNFPRILSPNCIARQKGKVLVGKEVDEAKHFSNINFRRPHERGYLVDCKLEQQILDKIFRTEGSLQNLEKETSTVVLTNPPFTPKTIQEDITEIMLETYQFYALTMLSTPFCNTVGCSKKIQKENKALSKFSSCLVVDSGFSFTYISPVIQHLVQKKSVRRIDVGGKLLTNQLKEEISLRYYDLRDENYIVNYMKEKMCFVSLNFIEDLKQRDQLAVRYILPDYINSRVGYEKQVWEKLSKDEQFVPLSTERISIPEVLFHPSDIGLDQCGIAEGIYESVESLKAPEYKALMYSSIVLVGGNTLFPNFAQRVRNELKTLVDSKYDVNVMEVKKPIWNCWNGAHSFSQQNESFKFTVSKQEYEENGHSLCFSRFIL